MWLLTTIITGKDVKCIKVQYNMVIFNTQIFISVRNYHVEWEKKWYQVKMRL